MAWFGGGLSKLTDEISNLGNLTREVLSDTLSNQDQDEPSEMAEDALQRRSSNLPELEEKVKTQEDVIETLKRENDLLMKKLTDQMLSLDQASPRSTIARSYQSAVDNWGGFDDEDDKGSDGRNTPGRRSSGPQFPGGDFEFDDQKEETQDELSLLKTQLDQLEKENEDLLRETAEIPELRSRIKQLHKENNLLIKSTDKFEREVESSKKLLDEQRDSITRLESQVSQMQHDMAAQSSTIAELTQENSQLREAVDNTQDENSNLSTGVEQLDMQHSRDLQDLMDSKRDADRRIIVLEEELSNLRAALAEKSELPSPDIIEAGIQTEPELPLPLEPCQTGSDNSDELSEAYDMLQTELDDLKAKFQEVPNVEDYTEKIRAFTEEVSQLKTKENDLHIRIEELEEKLREKADDEKTLSYQTDEKSIEISQLTEHNRFLQEEMDTLKDKLRDIDENVTESQAGKDAVAKKDELIERLKAELEEVKKVLEEKKRAADEWGSSDVWGTSSSNDKEYDKLLEEKQELSDTIQNQQKLIATLESSIEVLKIETDQLMQQKALVTELQSKVDILEVRLEQKEKEMQVWTETETWGGTELEKENVAFKVELATIKNVLDEERDTNAKLKAHSESLQKQLLEKKAEIEEWGSNDAWESGDNAKIAELKSLQEENAVLNQQVAVLQTKLRSVEDSLKNKDNELDDWGQGDDWGSDSSSELSTLRSRCKQQENIIAELKCKEGVLKQSLAEKESELSEWGDNSDWGTGSSSDFNSLREESGILKEKLSEQKAIIGKLKSQLDAAQQSTSSQHVADRDSRIEILSRENESLRTRVEQLGLVIENNYVEESEPVNNSSAQLIADKERLDEEVNVLTQENSELNKKLELALEKQKGLEEEITQLEDDTNTLREQLESKDQVDDSLENTLRHEIQDLHTKLVTSEALVNQLQVEKQELNIKYEELNGKYEQIQEKLKSQLANDTIDIDTLIKNLQTKEEELCKLLDEKNTFESMKLEKENLEVQLDNLNTNYQDKINTLIQTNNDLEVKIAELNNLQHNKNNDINDLNKRFRLFEENNAFLQRTICDLERNLDEKLKEINEKEIIYNERIEASNNKIQELVKDNDNLKAQIVSHTESIQVVKQEQTQLSATPVDDSILIENEQLRSHLETTRQETHLTIENLQNQIAHKDHEVNTKVAKINELIEKCQCYEAKCNELESTISAKLTDFSTKEQLNKRKIQELSEMLESVQAENISTKQMNEELQSITQSLKHTIQSFEEDRKVLDSYKQRVQELDTKLSQEIESKAQTVQTLELQLKKMHDQLSSYAHVENEIAQYESQVQQLEQTQATLLAERTQWIHEFEIKNNTVADLQKQLNDYNNKLTHSSDIDQELSGLRAHVQELEQHKQELQKQIQEQSISTNFLRNELQALRDEFSQTKATNENLAQEKNTLMEIKTALESQLSEWSEKEKQYSQKLTESDEAQKRLSEEIAALTAQAVPSDAYASIETVLKDKDDRLNEMLKKCESKDVELQKLQQSLEHQLSEKYQYEKETLELRRNISAYENQTQLLKSTTEDLQYQLQEKEKMILELNEMKQSFFIGDSKDSVRYSDEEHIEELRELQLMNESLQNQVQSSASEIENMKETIYYLEQYNRQLRQSPQDTSQLAILRSDLAEQRRINQQLVQTVTIKHEESVNYHQEIQRLNEVLREELPKIKNLNDQVIALEKSLKTQGDTLAAKERQLAQTQEQLSLTHSQLEEVTQSLSSNNRPAADGEPAQEREITAQLAAPVDSSREREELAILSREKEELANRVLTLQDEKAMLLNEINGLRLNQNSLYNEHERLKQHLLHIEEEYTAELVKAEQNLQETQSKLRDAEDRVKSSASAYTSASVRTNQQLESLTSQVKSLSEQKEKLQEKLNSAEDLVEKHKASLTNLQIVLEQFQADKENEISQSLEFLQGEINNSYAKNNELTQLINSLQHQLQVARESLSAAGRLSEELNQKEQHITELNNKVDQLIEELNKSELKLKEMNNGGKVDKCLMTNMLVNFLTAPSRPARNQALQILATVIEMTIQDRQRIGLDPPSAYNPNQSLSEAFIQFLENESSPRAKSQTSTPASRRTSSTTSPLLFPESVLPSLPQFPTTGSMLKDVLHSDS